jgi:hypothetical protein
VVRSFQAAASDSAESAPGPGFGRFGGGSTRPPLKAGLNRFSWDMRYPGFVTFPGMIMWAAGSRGPMALPGDYTVRLTADGTQRTAALQVGLDPRLEGRVSLDDLRARFELAQQVIQRVNEANNAVLLSRDVKEQVDDRLEQTDHAQIEQVGARVKSRISEVEGKIYQVKNQSNQDPLNYPIMLNNKLGALLGVIERGEYRPTDQSYDVFEMLSGQLTEELDALNVIIATDLAELNRLLRENDLPEVRAEQQGKVTT